MPNSDTANDLLKGLITLQEQAIQNQNETNDVVRELAKSVQDLVITDKQRLIKDEHQKEINDDIIVRIDKESARLDIIIKENNPTWLKSKWMHANIDRAVIAVVVITAVGIVNYFYKFK